jgi:hypothetical protein
LAEEIAEMEKKAAVKIAALTMVSEEEASTRRADLEKKMKSGSGFDAIDDSEVLV